MEEPPITFDDVGEPPDYVNIEDSSSPKLDDEIESQVAAVEQRDADRFSNRVEQTHRAPIWPRRRDRSQSRRAQHGQRRAHGQRRPRRDDSDEQDDEQQQRNSRSLRAGLFLIIALTAIPVIAVLVMFASNSGAPTAPPDIDITPRKPTTDAYISIQPAPPPPTIPLVKQTPLHLPQRSSY